MLHEKAGMMFHSLLAVTVGNRTFLAGWLILLTTGLATVGSKVYIGRSVEIAELQMKLDVINTTLLKMDRTLESNAAMLTAILVEQGRVQQELRDHTDATRAAKK